MNYNINCASVSLAAAASVTALCYNNIVMVGGAGAVSHCYVVHFIKFLCDNQLYCNKINTKFPSQDKTLLTLNSKTKNQFEHNNMIQKVIHSYNFHEFNKECNYLLYGI